VNNSASIRGGSSSNDEATFTKIPLDQLQISPDNVRRREITADLDDLAYSMETFGLQQPIVVQQRGEKYEILIGQRRFLAAKQLGWEKIDARVLSQPLNELEAKVASLSENAQRRELTAQDKAETVTYLREQLGSVKAVANHVGLSEATVRKWLGYAAVPDAVKRLVEDRQITRSTAIRIAENVQDDSSVLAIAERLATLRPPAEERQRILDAVEQFPTRSVDVIFEKANEMKYQKEIIFVLPERWSEAIERASRELEREPNEIAMEATIDWLERFIITGRQG
jgi:ParB family chromosome partitioning protein